MSLQPTVGDQIAYKKKKYGEARRKRVQAGLSALGAGAGAASIGLVTAGKVKKLPKLVDAGFTAGSVGAGIGAVSGATFARNQLKEAQEARSEAKQPMNNAYKVRKSLVELSKAAKRREAPPSEEAWRKAGGRKDDWRSYVSERAKQAYDEPLAPYRAKARKAERNRNVLAGAAAAAPVGGLLIAGEKGAAVGSAIGAGATGGAWYQHKQAGKHDLRSRRIRARGFQRQLDEKVDKAGGARMGGFVRTAGGKVTHRSGAVIPKARVLRAVPQYRRSYP